MVKPTLNVLEACSRLALIEGQKENKKGGKEMEGNVGSILPEGPLIVFSPHIIILSALVVTLLLSIVSWKKPSLTRFSIPIVIVAWVISAGFYFYAFYRLLAHIYLVEAILCAIATILFLKKATSLGEK